MITTVMVSLMNQMATLTLFNRFMRVKAKKLEHHLMPFGATAGMHFLNWKVKLVLNLIN